MSLDAPAPGSRVGWRAEHREVIFLRIALLAVIVFQAHDGDSLNLAGLAQSGCQKRARQVFLVGAHFAQRQPLALLGDKLPVHALVVTELEGCLSPLLRAERGQKAAGGLRHHRNRVDMVVYAARRVLTAAHETVARFARNQTASQDS